MTSLQLIRLFAARYSYLLAAHREAQWQVQAPASPSLLMRRHAVLWRIKTLLFALRGKWRAAARAYEIWLEYQNRVSEFEAEAMFQNGGVW